MLTKVNKSSINKEEVKIMEINLDFEKEKNKTISARIPEKIFSRAEQFLRKYKISLSEYFRKR